MPAQMSPELMHRLCTAPCGGGTCGKRRGTRSGHGLPQETQYVVVRSERHSNLHLPSNPPGRPGTVDEIPAN